MGNPNAIFKANFNKYLRGVKGALSNNKYALIDPVLERVYEEIDNFREDNPDADITKIRVNYSLEDLDFSVIEFDPLDTSNARLADIIVSILKTNIKNQEQLNNYSNKRAQDGILEISFNIIYEDKTSEVFTCSEEIPKSEPPQR